jgi:hypothetical protein
MALPAEALVLNFFGDGDPVWWYSISSLFVLRITVMDQSFITCHYPM